MKTSNRWWIVLLIAVAGCGPVNYWMGSYADTLSEMFPSIMPNTKQYVYPPGYDPAPPVPRNGPQVKKSEPEKPLPGDELYGPIDTSGSVPAGSEVPAQTGSQAAPVAGQAAASRPAASNSAGPIPSGPSLGQ